MIIYYGSHRLTQVSTPVSRRGLRPGGRTACPGGLLGGSRVRPEPTRPTCFPGHGTHPLSHTQLLTGQRLREGSLRSSPRCLALTKATEVSIKLTPEHFFFQGNVFLLTFLMKLGRSFTQSECSKDRRGSAPGVFPAPGTAWPALPQRQGCASLLGRAGLGSQAQLLTCLPLPLPRRLWDPTPHWASRCC